ncbi:MAG: methionine biosynthesis protein MetW [Candidatus Helarchaeota archaeon]
MNLRLDLKKIFEIIEPNTRVLDIGCGNGDLINVLVTRKKVKAIGIEKNPKQVAKCISKGLNVIQSDALNGLKDYPLDSFDYVILSITLQAIDDPEFLISEMLRIGKNAIISIKNLSNWINRISFFISGEIPFFKNIEGQFSTKGIGLSNIKYFRNFCKDKNFKIIKELYLPNSSFNKLFLYNYLFSNTGIYVLKRN